MAKLNEKNKVSLLNGDEDLILLTKTGGIIRFSDVSSFLNLIMDEIKIGGRNYVDLTKLTSYRTYNTIPTVSGNIITTQILKAASTSSVLNFTLSISDYFPTVGEVYTVSGILKKNDSVVTKSMWIDKAATTYNRPLNFKVDDINGYFAITQKWSVNSNWLFHTTIQGAVDDVLTIEGLMFEKGNIASDWKPFIITP